MIETQLEVGKLIASVEHLCERMDHVSERLERLEDLAQRGRVLIAYQDRHGLRTIQGIVSRFAPDKENDTAAYIAAVIASASDDALTGPEDEVDLHRYPVLAALARAIIRQENGEQPYSRAEQRAADAAKLLRIRDDQMHVARPESGELDERLRTGRF